MPAVTLYLASDVIKCCWLRGSPNKRADDLIRVDLEAMLVGSERLQTTNTCMHPRKLDLFFGNEQCYLPHDRHHRQLFGPCHTDSSAITFQPEESLSDDGPFGRRSPSNGLTLIPNCPSRHSCYAIQLSSEAKL